MLVVDDVLDVCEAMAILLEAQGHHVVCATSASDALSVLDDVDPDVVLLDITLRDRSGYDVARELRSRSRGARMFVVAITGWDTDRDRRDAITAGFDMHIAKPVDGSILRRLMIVADDVLRSRT